MSRRGIVSLAATVIIGSACTATIPNDASAYSSSGIPIYQPGVDHGGVNRGGVYRGAHHRGGHYRCDPWRGGRRRGCRRCPCRSILRTALRILSSRPVLLIGHCLISRGKRRARDRNPRRWPVICMLIGTWAVTWVVDHSPVVVWAFPP